MQCASALLSSVACPTVSHFPIYLVNGTILKKKPPLLNVTFILMFSKISIRNISHFKEN